ncbi:hypothetical protein ACWIW6_10670, partial [Ursidibacter sp. B-7004-1]
RFGYKIFSNQTACLSFLCSKSLYVLSPLFSKDGLGEIWLQNFFKSDRLFILSLSKISLCFIPLFSKEGLGEIWLQNFLKIRPLAFIQAVSFYIKFPITSELDLQANL